MTSPAQMLVRHEWRPVSYAAKKFNRTERCIEYWCSRGTFTAVGLPVYQDTRKRWWILMVEDDPICNPETA